MSPKIYDLLAKHLGQIILATAILIASWFYSQSNRYSHVQGALVLDRWTGTIFKKPVETTYQSPEEFWKTHPRSQLPPGFELEK